MGGRRPVGGGSGPVLGRRDAVVGGARHLLTGVLQVDAEAGALHAGRDDVGELDVQQPEHLAQQTRQRFLRPESMASWIAAPACCRWSHWTPSPASAALSRWVTSRIRW